MYIEDKKDIDVHEEGGLEDSSDFDKDEEIIYNSNDFPQKIQTLKQKLEKCVKERKEYLEGWQRSRADFLNFKKEVEGERKIYATRAHENVMFDVLPVLDSFEMAFSAKEAWEKVDKTWRVGVENIYTQLIQMCERYGLRAFDDGGSAFDPLRHISVGAFPVTDKKKDGVILEAVQKGYMFMDNIIRPARVKIGEYKAEE